MPIFDCAHPIIIEVTFIFPKFVSGCKRLAYLINSFLKIQQMFEFHDLKSHTHFRPRKKSRQYYFNYFSFSEFVSTHQKSVYSINSFLRYSKFYGPVTRVVKPIFDHAIANIFQSTFNFHEFVSTWKESGFCVNLF